MTSSLTALPAFYIERVERYAKGDVVVCGRLERPTGASGGPSWFWLWVVDDHAVPVTIHELDPQSGRIVALLPAEGMRPEMRAGATLRWMSAYWQADHVHMIRKGEWQLRSFTAEDAICFELDGATGWNRADEEIPHGAAVKGIQPGGWDHEHCEICDRSIGRGGFPEGYVDREDHWLCPPCHDRWAKPRDLGFLVAASK